MFLSSADYRAILALMTRVESIKPNEARAFCELENRVTQQHNLAKQVEDGHLRIEVHQLDAPVPVTAEPVNGEAALSVPDEIVIPVNRRIRRAAARRSKK